MRRLSELLVTLKCLYPDSQPQVYRGRAMASLTKEMLIQKIQEHGEEPPSSWKKSQLRARLEELKEEKGTTTVDQLKVTTAALNKAARKKAWLQEHVRDVLQVPITMNENIPELLSKGHKAIMEQVPPIGRDVMGFGKHAEMSYLEVKMHHPDYVQWCLKTESEEDVNWRMQRFLKWIRQPEMGYPSPMTTMNTTPKRAVRTPIGMSRGRGSGHQSSDATEGSFQLVKQAAEVKINSSDEEVVDSEIQIAQLEDRIRELRRAQALERKDPNMKVDHEIKTRKMNSPAE